MSNTNVRTKSIDWKPKTPLEKLLMVIASCLAISNSIALLLYLNYRYEQSGINFFYHRPVAVSVAVIVACLMILKSVQRIIVYRLYRYFYVRNWCYENNDEGSYG
jgi:hypothetical protein